MASRPAAAAWLRRPGRLDRSDGRAGDCIAAGSRPRHDDQFDAGLIDEAAALRERYDPALPAFAAIGYREAWAVLDGEPDTRGGDRGGRPPQPGVREAQRTWFRAQTGHRVAGRATDRWPALRIRDATPCRRTSTARSRKTSVRQSRSARAMPAPLASSVTPIGRSRGLALLDVGPAGQIGLGGAQDHRLRERRRIRRSRPGLGQRSGLHFGRP